AASGDLAGRAGADRQWPPGHDFRQLTAIDSKNVSLKPVVALVGRPNVGKSTLFNRLTRSRSALVADFSGLTRDRHYGEGRVGDKPFIVIDTGGFEPVAKSGILLEMARQTE